MLWGVQWTGGTIRIYPKAYEGEKGAENDSRLHHAVVIKLTEELGATDAALVEFWLIDLQIKRRGFGI